MNNSNTIAIAVASLLVGGVAMATYQNNRGPAPGETADSAAMSLADNGKHGPLDTAVSARGLDYAPVLAVQPVTESQPVYARVLSVDPIRETSTTSAPRQICEDRLVQERLPERDGHVGGTVAGAVIGGLVGNRLGREVHDSRDRRHLATVGGAVAGGFIGRRILIPMVGTGHYKEAWRRVLSDPNLSLRDVAAIMGVHERTVSYRRAKIGKTDDRQKKLL